MKFVDTPESWTMLHTSTWVMNIFAVFFILAGHEHYSIDVFIAFYISSRLFLYYHTYAYNHNNLTTTDSRMRLWFPLGWFFESGGVGRVENVFDLPIPFRFKVKEMKTTTKTKDGNVMLEKETEILTHDKPEEVNANESLMNALKNTKLTDTETVYSDGLRNRLISTGSS